MTLREKVEDVFFNGYSMSIADKVDAILALLSTADSEQREDWRGWWKCEKCEKIYSEKVTSHYASWNKHPYQTELCDGKMVPHERRAAPTRPAEQREVADLRRKLEDAVHEKNLATVEAIGHDHAEGHLGALVDELRVQLAASSLANAALRTALGWYAIPGHYVSSSVYMGGGQGPTMADNDDGRRARAALALPADSLAQEVVKYMRHLATCDKASNLSPYTPCTCGLDALLAKLGGPR